MFPFPDCVQSPHVPQCPGPDHAVSSGFQHTALAFLDSCTPILPEAAALLPQMDV